MFPGLQHIPRMRLAIGYSYNGECPNNGRWCVVPKKKGRSCRTETGRMLSGKDTDKLVLYGQQILACRYGIQQLEGLAGSGYRIDLNQGMDARLVDDRMAGILSRITWIRFIVLV